MYELSPALKSLLFQKMEHEPLTVEEEFCWNHWVVTELERDQDYEFDLDDPETRQSFIYFLQLESEVDEACRHLKESILEPSMQTANNSHYLPRNRRRTSWTSFKYSVAALALVALGIYLWKLASGPVAHEGKESTSAVVKPSFSPGKQHASLYLSDGRLMSVQALKDSPVIEKAWKIELLGDSMISYKARILGDSSKFYKTGPLSINNPISNRLVTQGNEAFALRLPDGTTVWLNNGSSLIYPISLSNGNGPVELTGEGYFEVAKNRSTPFRVNTLQNTEVIAHGTKFCIKAYNDDSAVETVLLEGSVEVKAGALSATLQPGEQVAVINGLLQSRTEVEKLSYAIAWKDGNIRLEGEDIRSVMKQIGRWYNVEVEFSGPVPTRKLAGTIPRRLDLDKVLERLKFIDRSLAFSWRQNKLIVSETSTNP